uniref:Lysosome-associated membrane glycoprotein 2-like transmembrane domain-containing protein n=1 Tax=Meloidogyne incognita TaxID=6306 RepID=A0A914KP47_MELIC
MKLLILYTAIFFMVAECSFAIHLSVPDKPSKKTFCLIFEAGITGTLQYKDEHNSTLTRQFTVPESGETTLDEDASTCGEKLQRLTFNFVPLMTPTVPETETNYPWRISLEFNKSDDGHSYMLKEYLLTVFFYSTMNSTEQNVTIPHYYGQPKKSRVDWTASVNSSYGPTGFLCSQNDLPLNSTDSVLHFNQLKIVAFANQTSPSFNNTQSYQYCAADARTSDLVPIIVGACLGGLVIIVLVAYLIGRVRAKRQGYNSV